MTIIPLRLTDWCVVYFRCYTANLNGVYHTGWYSAGPEAFADGIVWYTLREDDRYSLKKVEMKIRPVYI